MRGIIIPAGAQPVVRGSPPAPRSKRISMAPPVEAPCTVHCALVAVGEATGDAERVGRWDPSGLQSMALYL
jgi:hypothetical protein